jgi:hypothetical protein
MKKLAEEQNNSRKDAKPQRVAKQTKEFPFAPWRAMFLNFFTASSCLCCYLCTANGCGTRHLAGARGQGGWDQVVSSNSLWTMAGELLGYQVVKGFGVKSRTHGLERRT